MSGSLYRQNEDYPQQQGLNKGQPRSNMKSFISGVAAGLYDWMEMITRRRLRSGVGRCDAGSPPADA